MKKIFVLIMVLLSFNLTAFGITDKDIEENPEDKAILKEYKRVTKEASIAEALDLMKNGKLTNFSYKAIMGENLTQKPIEIEYKNLSELGQDYANFDALGWKKKNKLYIYINPKHQDAPKEALCALLSHEALHQDEFNSINEETYAWTLEAAVWEKFTENMPHLLATSHPLVKRENLIRQLFIKGDYTDKYIRKSIMVNPGYQNLPSRSPGFEDSL